MMMNAATNTTEGRIREYRDESGLSTRQLEAGLWYVRHRKLFFILLIVVLGATAIGTLGFSLYKVGNYFFVERHQEEQNFLELTSGTSLVTNRSNAAGNLTYSDARILPGNNGEADLVAAVTNVNQRSMISFTYYFNVNGAKVATNTDFVFPGDTKYLMAFRQRVPAGASANLVIENLTFQRLDTHVVGNWEQYQADRLNFLIEDAAFSPAAESGLSEKVSLGELNFKITNQSGYSYKSVMLSILLKSGDGIAAATRYRLDNFRSGETRTVRMTWPGRLPVITQVDIVPDVNILDDDVYLRYSSL